MNETEVNRVNSLVSKYKRPLIVVFAIVIVSVAVALFVLTRNDNGNADAPTSLVQEFDPNGITQNQSEDAASALPAFSEEEIQKLKDELADAHASLEKANADYNAEISAREADGKALEDSKNKLDALESEKNKLLAELKAKEAELTLKTPPILDVKKIIGMYEGCGELVTMTYEYEVTEVSKQEGNIFTNKTILYLIPGTLKIGVNFDEIKNGITVSDSAKTVTVTVPTAYFVSNEIDETNVQRYDVNRAIFSKVEDRDYLAVATAAKNNAELKVEADGMLEYAQRLAGLEISGLIEPLTSTSGYQIVIVYD